MEHQKALEKLIDYLQPLLASGMDMPSVGPLALAYIQGAVSSPLEAAKLLQQAVQDPIIEAIVKPPERYQRKGQKTMEQLQQVTRILGREDHQVVNPDETLTVHPSIPLSRTTRSGGVK